MIFNNRFCQCKPIPVPSSPFEVVYGVKSFSIICGGIPPPLSAIFIMLSFSFSLISILIFGCKPVFADFSLQASRALLIIFKITCFSSFSKPNRVTVEFSSICIVALYFKIWCSITLKTYFGLNLLQQTLLSLYLV